MANIRMRFIAYENKPILLGNGDKTIGSQIDELIVEALDHHANIDEVAFQVEEAEWQDMMRQYHAAKDPVTARNKRV